MILFTFYFFASYWVYSGWKRKKIRDWSVFTFSDLVTFGLWILTCMEGTLLWAFLSSCSSPLPVSFQFFWLILLSLKKLRIRSPAKIKMSTSMTVICSSPLYSWILPPPQTKKEVPVIFSISSLPLIFSIFREYEKPGTIGSWLPAPWLSWKLLFLIFLVQYVYSC